MDKTFRLILIVFAGLSLSLIGVVVVSVTNLQRANQSAQWVNHTHALIAEVNDAVAASQRAEGALHTYLLTNSPAHELLFQQGFADVAEHIEVAKALADAEPDKSYQIAELEAALVNRAERARALLTNHRSGANEEVKAQLNNEANEVSTETIRVARRVVAFHQKLLSERDRVAFEKDMRARTTLYIGAGLTLLMITTAGWFIRNDLAARQREAKLLAKTNEELEKRVAERTAELADANDKLSAENIEVRWSAQALEHQLRYSNLIVESVANPVVVITKALNISRVNPAMEKITGGTSVDLADQPLTNHVVLESTSGEEEESIDPLTWSLRHGQDLVERPAEVISQSGRRKPVIFNLYPLRDHDKVVGGVVVLRIRPIKT
jgi:PAS domain S-box-containing protein